MPANCWRQRTPPEFAGVHRAAADADRIEYSVWALSFGNRDNIHLCRDSNPAKPSKITQDMIDSGVLTLELETRFGEDILEHDIRINRICTDTPTERNRGNVSRNRATTTFIIS